MAKFPARDSTRFVTLLLRMMVSAFLAEHLVLALARGKMFTTVLTQSDRICKVN